MSQRGRDWQVNFGPWSAKTRKIYETVPFPNGADDGVFTPEKLVITSTVPQLVTGDVLVCSVEIDGKAQPWPNKIEIREGLVIYTITHWDKIKTGSKIEFEVEVRSVDQVYCACFGHFKTGPA